MRRTHISDISHRNLVGAYTQGVSMNRSRGFSTYIDAYRSWRAACLADTVSGPLSEHSVVPRIVSDVEARRRLQRWREEDLRSRLRSTQAAQAAAQVGDTSPRQPSPCHSGPSQPVPRQPAPSQAAAAASSSAQAGPSQSTSTAAPPPSASAAVPGVVEFDAPSSSASPSCGKGKNPYVDHEEPVAWVVIRGIRPGVYYHR